MTWTSPHGLLSTTPRPLPLFFLLGVEGRLKKIIKQDLLVVMNDGLDESGAGARDP